jgi:hypothetical protein
MGEDAHAGGTRVWVGPLLVGLAALAVVAATLAPDGSGPGVTCDELYHVYQGKRLVTALRHQGLEFFKPANIDQNFPWKPGGPPVQGPLGYWILGWTHYLFDLSPDNPNAVSIAAARFAPAIAFALLVLIVGVWTGRREGALAGTAAAAAVALMPRVFGHAHLAALDMLTTLFFVAAVLAVAEAARGGRVWQYALAGAVWGATMLVRLHGLLVAPPVVAWLVWRWYRNRQQGPRAIWPLAAWLCGGVAVLFAGWPWLWLAPVARFQQYLSSGTARQALHVFYLGQVWNDRDVPWHYPWVMFAVTVPVGLLALGAIGIWARLPGKPRCPHPNPLPEGEGTALANLFPKGEGALLGGAMLFVLLVFSLPRTPVYDGERLFLMVFPLWAIWVGIGAAWLCRSHQAHGNPKRKRGNTAPGPRLRFGLLSDWRPGCTMVAVVGFIALQGLGLVIYAPCHLSYYNLLVGGLAGAERLGFEVTYWGDTVREPMLAEAARRAPGQTILFAPSLAPFQAPAVEMWSPALHDAHVQLVGWDAAKPDEAERCGYAVIYHRRADPAGEKWILDRGQTVAEYSKQGVWLARLVRLVPPRRGKPVE